MFFMLCFGQISVLKFNSYLWKNFVEEGKCGKKGNGASLSIPGAENSPMIGGEHLCLMFCLQNNCVKILL